MDQLNRSSEELKQAIKALTVALNSTELDQRLRCIHNGRQHAAIAHDLILEWRGVKKVEE